MRRFIPVVAIASALSIVATMTACSADEDPTASETTTETVTVFAAASLTGAFERIAADFETDNPGVDIVLNFGPSDGLAAQIQSEGVADVFASASESWMDEVEAEPGVTDRADFATNRLVVVTPPDNPAGISSFEDLATPGVQLVLAAEGVPVGDYAREALANAGIADAALENVVSNEVDNAAVVAKVVAGEADAAIVYTSDVSAAAGNDLKAIEFPEDVNVLATYPIAVVAETDSPHAHLFVDTVVGSEGQRILMEFGFGMPEG